jgi:L-ascorbate oxidase
MWIVANDGGFVQPTKVNIVTLTNAERVTVMVKLDQPATTMPFVSTAPVHCSRCKAM